jgi:pyruvate formate lyase activating enzyme
MAKALIFNIQKFCVHDGPGIRTTVFFKGCPLTCVWCHNPESQNFAPEFLYSFEKCTCCGRCVKCCPEGAARVDGNSANCLLCGTCADICPNEVRLIAGKEYGLDELLVEIEKDRPFYEQSGGGVTLSGGEALCQINFVEELVQACWQKGISIVVDTCGQVPWACFSRVLNGTDLFLYDLKFGDPVRHKIYTGEDNRQVVTNLRRLCDTGAKVNLRVPLIEGINTDDANIDSIIALTRKLNIGMVNLLPYHDIARDKYKRLNRAYRNGMSCPPPERLEQIQCRFTKSGFTVKIGG